MLTNGYRVYLRLGDKVSHLDYREWGEGTVVEEMTSTVIGGTCLVRILFEDGRQRTFNNDMDAEMCCYYFGLRKLRGLEEEFLGPPRAHRRSAGRPRRVPAPHRRHHT